MDQRTLSRSQQCRARIGVLRKLGGAGPTHQLPMPEGADRDRLPAIADVAAIGLFGRFLLRRRPRQRSDARALLGREAKALPERLDAGIALAVELEWGWRK